MRNDSSEEFLNLLADAGPTCQITYVSNGMAVAQGIPPEPRKTVASLAQEFLHRSGGDVCVLLAGRLQSDFSNDGYSTEKAIANRCRSVLGDPGEKHYSAHRRIDLVLDTLGGSLDSAFKTVLYLSRFTSDLRVYVPRRAKSAGTLIAIGTKQLYMTPFSELGPLDTQIRDPRNPTETLSALDCYQSVDYVRKFGLNSLKQVLLALSKELKTGIPLSELLVTAADFASANTEPMLAGIKALDFGGWGRTLQIGELYAQSLLSRAGYEDKEISAIAAKLVYGYTHHPYPIDIREAAGIGLAVQPMRPSLAEPALKMITQCANLGIDIAVGAWKADRNHRIRHAIHKTTAGAPQESQVMLPGRDDAPAAGQKQAVAFIDPIYYDLAEEQRAFRISRWRRFWSR